MYAPTDFDRPDSPESPARPPRPPLPQERLVGLVAMLILLALCVLMAMSMDSDIFNPYNTAVAQTQTATASRGLGAPGNEDGGTPAATWVHPTFEPRPTRTPLNPNQAARN